VNNSKFNIDYILELGEDDSKHEIKHLGMGNTNATDIMKMFQQIKNFINEHRHFPCSLLELMQL